MKNIIRQLFSIVGIISTLFLTSCGDDDEISFDFKDQILQGQIDGIAFTSKGGFFDDGFEEGTMRIRIYDVSEEGDPCDIIFSDFATVSINVTKEVGLYKIRSGFDSSDSNQINLINLDDDGVPLNILTDGVVEILTITDTEVTGRMDASFDSNSQVNGNFTVISCSVE